MKCENCGGNLSLEDVVCPYCDSVNEHAIQHIRDMNRYKREFEGTRKNVEEVAKKHTGNMVKIVTICILLIAIIICCFLSDQSYSIRREINENKAEREFEQNQKILLQYLEEGEYYSFYSYIYEKNIPTYHGKYEEFKEIYYATNQYTYIYDLVVSLQGNGKYIGKEEMWEMLITSVNDFYKVYDENNYLHIAEGEPYYEAVKGIEDRIKALLVTYMGLSKEDVENFGELTNTQRRRLIEESGVYEK